METHGEYFEALRGRLFGLAYRMLGARADAEDVVQDTYLRWHQADRTAIREPEAWLITVATRLAIDRLRTLRAAREVYTGPWLPEPIVHDSPSGPAAGLQRASDMSMAMLVLLERLAPDERAAFLLHDVFDAGYAEIAHVLEKSEAACRQIVHRARQRVRRARRRFQASDDARRCLLVTFTEALTARDDATLMRVFAPDARWISDGGGVVHASPRPLVGVDRVVRLALGLQRLYARAGASLDHAWVNGEPGLLVRVDGHVRGAFAFDVADDRIAAVYVVLNPQKLASLDAGL